MSELARSGTDYAGLTATEVGVVAQGRLSPMRVLPAKVLSGGVSAAVHFLAPRYGARQEVDGGLIAECVAIARDQYAHLGLEEIRQAYRLWAGQRFQALEMYGGQFNATQFGRVLAAYDRYRRGVSMELARQEADTSREERRRERQERHARDYARLVAEFPNEVQQAREHDLFDRPSAIPRTWYQLAERHGMIEYTEGEKLALCRRAEAAVLAEQEAQRAAATSTTTLRTLTAHFDRVGTTPIYERAKQYAVWTKVLGRKLLDQ